MPTPDLVIADLYPWLHQCAADIVRRGEAHQPLLVLAKTTAEGVEIQVIPISDASEEDAIAFFHKVALESHSLFACLIKEAWYTSAEIATKKEVDSVIKRQVSVADLDHKAEALLFAFLGRTFQKISICKIDRKNATLEYALIDDYSEDKIAALSPIFPQRQKLH